MEKIKSEKSNLARERWRLLKNLLFSENQAELLSRPSVISKRSHGQFQLFDVIPYKPKTNQDSHTAEQAATYSWFLYSHNQKPLFAIRQTTPKLTLKDFFSEYSGFLNTGNICIWPAEEILAWYTFENPDKFRGKRICELGGGMAALAGVVCASQPSNQENTNTKKEKEENSESNDVKDSFQKTVILTEGNPQCVTNLNSIISENSHPENRFFPETNHVTSRQLLWNAKCQDYKREFDILLVADCLYAEEVQDSLYHVINSTLSRDGVAYIMAPKRGPSFEAFKTRVEKGGIFSVEIQTDYSQRVTEKHQDFIKNDNHYNPDIHYPLLMILRFKS